MRKIFLKIKTAIKETDLLLLFLCFVTSFYGILMVYSATRATVAEGDILSRDARTMLLAVALGGVLAIIISFFDYNFHVCIVSDSIFLWLQRKDVEGLQK